MIQRNTLAERQQKILVLVRRIESLADVHAQRKTRRFIVRPSRATEGGPPGLSVK